MNLLPSIARTPETNRSVRLSNGGKRRLLAVRGEPLFLADWERVLFIHYEVDAGALRKEVPFEIDLWQGRALVSVVAFNMRDMRPRRGGRIAAWPFKPISTHPFLNVRTYVKHEGEPGIYFMTEWLSNRLSVLLGPLIYGLPYRFARIDYKHTHEQGALAGRVQAPGRSGSFTFEARLGSRLSFDSCLPDSQDEFLLERYTAFTSSGSTRRFFRIWHPPWPQVPVEISVSDDSILTSLWPWFRKARLLGANYSPGFRDVWMGWPRLVKQISPNSSENR